MDTYGVTVTTKGSGCTELVRANVPPVELEDRNTPQTGIAVVVTGGMVSVVQMST